uniref:CARD domain-containing protein n=1 Tax=Strongyloides venezuelensis TaxID=75913 RepID=A0A0K0F4R1_STRVS
MTFNLNVVSGFKASCASNKLQYGRCRVALRDNENIKNTVIWPNLNNRDREAIERILARGHGNHAKEISEYLTNRANPDDIRKSLR